MLAGDPNSLGAGDLCMDGSFHFRLRAVSACAALVGAACLWQPSAQAQTTASSSGNCPYWIDAKSGKHVRTGPPGWSPITSGNAYYYGGHNFVQLANGTWIDAGTGNPVRTGPPGWSPITSGNAYYYGGHNFVLIACPPPSPTSTGISPVPMQSGWYVGGYLVKTFGDNEFVEAAATSGLVTNDFRDRHDPLGGGAILGYKLTPFANNVVVSPFVSFEYLNAQVNHTFANGSFLGSTANVAGTAGVKVGPQLDLGVWLYGIAGVSVMSETLKVNFIPVASSTDAAVAGATVGAGAAWQPVFLQGFGAPVSLFAEYQHTWWQDATFTTPAASPAFNYTYRRQDDFVKFGFTVSLNAPQAVTPPTYPVKAPALK